MPPILIVSPTHAKGVHHRVFQLLCSPQINGSAGRQSYGLLKDVYAPGNLFVLTTERPPKPKVEDQTLRRLEHLDLQPLCTRKGRNPYTTKLNPTSIGLRLSSQRCGSQEGRQLCTRPRVAAKIDDRVFQQRYRPIDPDLFLRRGHD